MTRPRVPAGRFLAPNGCTRTKPLRELPLVADETEHVDRIREARRFADEPEMISAAILGSYADVNRRIFTQQHILEVAQAQERRPELQPQNRLRDVHRRAKDAHVDMSHEIHLVQKALDKAQLRGQPVNPRALERLEGLEALLDGVSVLRMAA